MKNQKVERCSEDKQIICFKITKYEERKKD